MDPRSLIELKHDALEFHRSIDPGLFYKMVGDSMSEFAGYGSDLAVHAFWRSYESFLRASEVLYVTEEMTAKVLEAAETLPEFMPLHSDAPMPACIAYFEGMEMTSWGEDGSRKRTSSALSWLAVEHDTASQFLIGHHIDFGTGQEFPYKTSMRNGLREMGLMPPRLLANSVVAWQTKEELRGEFNEKYADRHRGGTAPLLKTLWRLMQQEEISESSRMDPSRASSKRIRRSGGEPGQVRIVDLRRKTGGSQGRERYAREYDHRWPVRGHWRNQWYPSLGLNRPKWIEPHVRGPEDAPLIERDRVYRLR